MAEHTFLVLDEAGERVLGSGEFSKSTPAIEIVTALLVDGPVDTGLYRRFSPASVREGVMTFRVLDVGIVSTFEAEEWLSHAEANPGETLGLLFAEKVKVYYRPASVQHLDT